MTGSQWPNTKIDSNILDNYGPLKISRSCLYLSFDYQRLITGH